MLNYFSLEGPKTFASHEFVIQKFYIFIESNFNFVLSEFSICFNGRQRFQSKGSKNEGMIELGKVNPPL